LADYLIKTFRREEIRVMTIEAMRAVPNDSTSNPLISAEAINRRMALMTKRKNPRASSK